MRKALTLLGTLIIILLASSCTQDEFYVDSIKVIPYMTQPDSSMGMAVYIDTSLEETEVPMNFTLTSPDKRFTWSFDGSVVTYEDVTYSGSSDICMPKGTALPKGDWNLQITLSDGRVFDEIVSVNYSLESNPAESTAEMTEGLVYGATYDSKSNLATLKMII